MPHFESVIFIPSPRSKLRFNSKILVNGSPIIGLTTFIIVALTFSDPELSSNVRFAIVISTTIMFIAGLIWSAGEKEKKDGNFSGILSISDNFLSFQKNQLPWADVTDLHFRLGNYLNEDIRKSDDSFFDFRQHLRPGPTFSAGVNNYLSFKYSGKQYRVNFRLDNAEHRERFKDSLKEQLLLGNLSLMRYYTGLNLNYEEVQELKKAPLPI